MQSPRWPALSPLALLAALLSSGCGDGGTLADGRRNVAAVALTPAAAAVPRDGVQHFTASITDGAGMPIACPEAVVWSSSDSMVARVSSFGKAAAVAALVQGEAQIRVTCRDVTGTATLTVGLPEVVLVAISPASANVHQDGTQGFTASVTDLAGAPLACPALVWSSSDSAVARIAATGAASARATAVRAGAAQIRATCGNGVGTAALTVRPVTAASVTLDPAAATLARDASRSITATVRNLAGEVVPCPEPLVWSSDRPTVQVSSTGAATAEATARGSGEAQIRATCESAAGTATITVPRPALEQIVFIQNDDIYRINEDGSGLKNLTANNTHWHLSVEWAPDGTRMVFRKDIKYDSHLFVMNGDGSGQRNLAITSAAYFGPVWSPDGTRIASYGIKVWVTDADGSNQRELAPQSSQYGVVEEESPAWSPDGSRIAFLRATGDLGKSIPQIIVAGANGSNPTPLRTGVPGERFHDLRWSPDGTKFAFVLTRDFVRRVIVMNADGTGARQLTDRWSDDPEWSPDGTKLVFVSFTGGENLLSVANADGTGMRDVASIEDARNPEWSPDGTKLVFQAHNIYVINADGSGLTQLTSGYRAYDPSWRP